MKDTAAINVQVHLRVTSYADRQRTDPVVLLDKRGAQPETREGPRA